MDDIEKAINDDKEKSGQGDNANVDKKPTEEELKQARLAALDKEIADREASKALADQELKRIRDEKRKAKKTPAKEDEDEKEKVIDENDPDAKPWLKRIDDTVAPVQAELEREKAEIRQFALDDFLAARPALAKNPDKLKELMGVYERIHTASERNTEGVLRDLDKAYAAVYHKELLEAARQQKVNDARKDALFSDIAVSRGSTAYSAPKETVAKLTPDEERVLAKWGMSSQEWQKMKAEQDKKLAEESVI